MSTKNQVYNLYRGDLDQILDEVFEISDTKGWSWEDLANRADLCYTTVYRIGWRQTKTPHFQTVWKLARAIGLMLVTSTSRARYHVRRAS